MKKYKVIFTDTGDTVGTDLTLEEAERLAKQVTAHHMAMWSERSVTVIAVGTGHHRAQKAA